MLYYLFAFVAGVIITIAILYLIGLQERQRSISEVEFIQAELDAIKVDMAIAEAKSKRELAELEERERWRGRR